MNLKYCLINRSIVEVSGNDSSKFLQGLITRNINLLSNKNSIYTLLLTDKGRYLLDFFIIKNDPYLLIDINTNYIEIFNKIIQYYKLRTNIECKVNKNLKLYTIFNPLSFSYINPNYQENTININGNIIIRDPRILTLGLRIISKNNSFLKDSATRKYIKDFFNLTDSSNITEADTKEYTILRYKYTVPEVTELIQEKSIPLECNMEELNALSFNKGCFLGQEFTNSSKRIMLIRKKLITMEIKNYSKNNNYDFLKFKYVVNQYQEKVGKILSWCNNYIMVLVKIEYLQKENIRFFSDNVEFIPILPEWLRKSLKYFIK